MSTNTVDLSPQGLLNKDGNYVLQDEVIRDLEKYAWTGALLPVTIDAYKSRLGLPDDVAKKLDDVLKPLVQAYASVQGHCQRFKDKTYPGIVSLASDVYDYAQNAGGSIDESYYAIIVNSVNQLADTTDPQQQSELRETITSLIDSQRSLMKKLIDKTKNVEADMRSFEAPIKNDQKTLGDRGTALRQKLNVEEDVLNELQKKLEDLRNELDKDMKEYERDKLIAATTPTYAWIFPIGLVSAVVVAGIYGARAAKMAKRIEEIKKLIANDEGQAGEEKTSINYDKQVFADVSTTNAGVDHVVEHVEPAVKAVEGLQRICAGIIANLDRLQNLVNKDPRQAKQAVSNINVQTLVKQWDTLAAAADKYRKTAEVIEPEHKQLDVLEKQLKTESK